MREKIYSRFNGVTYNKALKRWVVRIRIREMPPKLVSYFKDTSSGEEEAARMADSARWWLQDFLTYEPKYNFPEELPPIFDIPNPVARIRQQALRSGVPQSMPFRVEFRPPEEHTFPVVGNLYSHVSMEAFREWLLTPNSYVRGECPKMVFDLFNASSGFDLDRWMDTPNELFQDHTPRALLDYAMRRLNGAPDSEAPLPQKPM